MREPVNRLRQMRVEAGWSQAQLIAAMRRVARDLKVALPEPESLKTNVRRWENARVAPGPEYRKVLRIVYGVTDDELGFPAVDTEEAPSLTGGFAVSRDGVGYLRTLLDAHVAADNVMGAAQVFGFVKHEAEQVNAATRDARGALRPQVVWTAMRFQELLGWLYQDTGRHDRAMAATNRACDFAAETNDRVWSAYLLMRKSNIAGEAGDPAIARALADAALTALPAPAPRLQAVILRQKANAHAALGEVRQFETAIEQAVTALQAPADEHDEVARYCTERYVAMEAAAGWTRLAAPARALRALTATTTRWPDGLRRDHGLYLARLATAHAAVGDVDHACLAGRDAIRVARETESARTLAELRRLRCQLLPARGHEQVATIRSAIASLVGTTPQGGDQHRDRALADDDLHR
jgi:transcriptional regulator with XRE-family HTH domain